MVFSLSILVTACLLTPQEPKPVAPPVLPAAEVAERIEVALDAGVAPACSTIEELGERTEPAVVKALGKALRHKADEVKVASLKALRFHGTEDAFKELMRHRADRTILEREAPGEAYFLALGQYEDLDALPVLTRNLRSRFRTDKRLEAQVLALGRMRHPSAIEALIKFLRSPGRQSKRARANAALSLYLLTGHEGGARALDWALWWKQNRRGFVLPKRRPPLSRNQERAWTTTWATPKEREAAAASKKKPRRKKGKDKGKGTDKGPAGGEAQGKGKGKGKGDSTSRGR